MKDRQPCQSEAEARLSPGSAIAVPAITKSLKKQPIDCRPAAIVIVSALNSISVVLDPKCVSKKLLLWVTHILLVLTICFP